MLKFGSADIFDKSKTRYRSSLRQRVFRILGGFSLHALQDKAAADIVSPWW